MAYQVYTTNAMSLQEVQNEEDEYFTSQFCGHYDMEYQNDEEDMSYAQGGE